MVGKYHVDLSHVSWDQNNISLILYFYWARMHCIDRKDIKDRKDF